MRRTLLLLSLCPSAALVALVTGGNKGIGKSIAKQLGGAGWSVILGCRSTALGEAAAAELRASGCSDVVCQRLDLTDPESIASTQQYIADSHGQLDALINNAAICFNDPTLYGKVEHTPFERQADITVATNYFGTAAVIQAMLPLLRAASAAGAAGRVVNVASYAGRLSILQRAPDKVAVVTAADLRVEQLDELMREFVRDVEAGVHAKHGWPNTCYGLSKLGIIALTKCLARDEPSLMVNSVDPGFCATDQNQNQGYISADDGAKTPVALALLPTDKFASGKHWYDSEQRERDWCSM